MEQVEINSDADAYIDITETYTYNDSGTRVSKEIVTNVGDDDNSGNDTTVNTDHLTDANNPTGYSQVIEEWDVSGTPDMAISYTFGHQAISQWDSTNDVLYFVTDGQGSTRLVANDAGIPVFPEFYDYDAYGNYIGVPANPKTTILYAGQNRDANTSQYYLRARYYNPATGGFNRLDPLSHTGSNPDLFNGYIYANANPISNIDPSGYFSLSGLMTSISTRAVLLSMNYIAANALYNIGTAVTAGEISKNHREESGRWVTALSGVAFGFGPLGGMAGVLSARGTSTGSAIIGYVGGGGMVFPASKVKDGIKYIVSHRSELVSAIKSKWNMDPRDNALLALGQVLKGVKSFSQWFGAEWDQGSFGGGFIGGNSLVMNAHTAGKVVGLAFGGGGTIQGVNVGGYVETYFGLSLSSGPNGAFSIGGGLTLSATTSPTGMITVGVSAFIPQNMYDWSFGDL